MTQDGDGSAPMRGSVAHRLAASLRDMNDEILARGADYSDILLDAARELDRSGISGHVERFQQSVEQFGLIVDQLALVLGMQAENDQRKAIGASMAYTENDFLSA